MSKKHKFWFRGIIIGSVVSGVSNLMTLGRLDIPNILVGTVLGIILAFFINGDKK